MRERRGEWCFFFCFVLFGVDGEETMCFIFVCENGGISESEKWRKREKLRRTERKSHREIDKVGERKISKRQRQRQRQTETDRDRETYTQREGKNKQPGKTKQKTDYVVSSESVFLKHLPLGWEMAHNCGIPE